MIKYSISVYQIIAAILPSKETFQRIVARQSEQK